MKKLLLTLAAMFAVAIGAMAVPAYPKPIKITQPDGSTITIRLYGDEHFHWTTTTDGYNVIQREDGFYYYDAPNSPARVRANDPARRGAADRSILSMTRTGVPAEAAQRAQASRALHNSASANQSGVNRAARMRAQATGEKFHSLVILVNFSDKAFTVSNPQTAYTNLLNQDGYSVNGATGSAWNYYRDNSNGRFDGSFDVVGPFTLPQTMAYYGGNGSAGAGGDTGVSSQAFFKNTIAAVGNNVNWATYADGNVVRSVFIFYAGYNEAEGGPANTIWPHQWGITTTIGSYTVNGYACTSEYSGASGATMCGIGTFSHEFGHVLGWPDFYDTNYDTNGYALNPDEFSIMAGGSYNNNGRTPPALMAMERDMQGWLNPVTLTTTGDYTLPHVSTDNAYKVLTATNNEYFWVETRGSTNKWDAGWSSNWGGILVTHVDRSSSYASRWNNNNLNAYSAHPCFMPVRANSTSTTYTYQTSSTGWLFPGSSNKTALSTTSHPQYKAWSGATVDGSFTNMAYSGGTASFTFTSSGTTPSVDPTSVSVSPTTTTIIVGKNILLTATVLPTNTTNGTVTWSSNNPAVATVGNTTGLVSGVTNGTATITATTVNGKTATCSVTVSPAEPTSVTVNPTTAAVGTGQSVQLTATVLPTDAVNKTVTWASGTPAVATVSATGLVSGITSGTATITVSTVNGKTATCLVTVSQGATSIQIQPTTTSVEIGKNVSLTATVLPENAVNKNVTWTSDDTTIATVSSNGSVLGVKAGIATITATVTGTTIKETCLVTVISPIGDIVLTSILQNDAILSWDYPETAIYKVEFQKGNDNVGDFTVSTKFIYLPNLTANTAYAVTVYLVDNQGAQIGTTKKTKTFSTLANSTEFVAMGLMKGAFESTEEIPLRAINLPANVVSVEWFVDNNKTEAPSVTLAKGVHKLRLEVVSTVEGVNSTETITKEITVK